MGGLSEQGGINRVFRITGQNPDLRDKMNAGKTLSFMCHRLFLGKYCISFCLGQGPVVDRVRNSGKWMEHCKPRAAVAGLL